MPDPQKLYIEVFNDGTNNLYIRDAEAQEEISQIKETIKNGSSYIGKFVSAVIDGETVTTIKEGDAPTSVTTTKGTFVPGTPASGQTKLNAGDYVQLQRTGDSSIELMWNGEAFDEFGSTSALKSLAFKDNATGSVTAAGSNAPSAVSFTGQTDGDFVTGFNDDAVAPSFTEGAFSAGTLPSKEADTFSAGSLPSFTEGEFSAGTLPSKEADTFSAGSLPSYSEGQFSAGTLPSMTYDETNRKLTFAAGTLPSKAADTFSAGSLPSYTEGAFSQGTLPSKAADTFGAGTLPSFTEGQFSAGTLPSKAADTFNAGSAATPTTGKAITAVGTGEAAAQTFTGSAVNVTVS